MNQRTHAWIAIRAIKLLKDEGKTENLVKLLEPYLQKAAIGAWIPDKRDAKVGGSRTENHIFKIKPYKGALEARFILKKDELIKHLGPERKLPGFLEGYKNILTDEWWGKAYKADPEPGQHLANRAMSLAINNIDMLILGDDHVQEMVPGKIDFIEEVDESTRVSSGQVALFFYMLSHFIADSLMPCHCDDRDLADYANGLHKELEGHWGKKVGTFFEDNNLSKNGLEADEIYEKAIAVDGKFSLSFENEVLDLKSNDVWWEIVVLCRGSFAVASIIAPPEKYPYKPDPQIMAPFETLFEQDQQGKQLLEGVDKVVIHDAVLNVALIWKYIWSKFKK